MFTHVASLATSAEMCNLDERGNEIVKATRARLHNLAENRLGQMLFVRAATQPPMSPIARKV
jgi:hypothetical protein